MTAAAKAVFSVVLTARLKVVPFSSWSPRDILCQLSAEVRSAGPGVAQGRLTRAAVATWPLSVRRGGHRRRRCNCFYNLRRQAEANILRHDFDLLEIVVTFGPQEFDYFFDQAFWSGCPCSQRNRLYSFQPLRLNVFTVIDQMRPGSQVASDFHQPV